MTDFIKIYLPGQTSPNIAVFGRWEDYEQVHTIRVADGRVAHRLELVDRGGCPIHPGVGECRHFVGNTEWVLMGKYRAEDEAKLIERIGDAL